MLISCVNKCLPAEADVVSRKFNIIGVSGRVSGSDLTIKHSEANLPSMARKPRIHYPGAVYHVMLRGNAGQDIFHDDADPEAVI